MSVLGCVRMHGVLQQMGLHVENGSLVVKRISTDKQQADIFTKPLPLQPFETHRKEIMGWCCILTNTPKTTKSYKNMRTLLSGW